MDRNSGINIIIKRGNMFWMICIFLGLILFSIEFYLFGNLTLYIGTCFYIIGIFALCIINKDINFSNPALKALNHIGSKLTTFIYLMHMMIITITETLLKPFLTENYVISMILPIFICVITTLIAFVYIFLKNKLMCFFNSKI